MKIALLGAAPSSKDLAPFHDPNWEIWCCSPPNYTAPRVDAWFELHAIERKMQHPANGPYINVLMNHPRVYVAQATPHLPNAVVYPKKEMLEAFAPFADPFMKSSLSWMLAMAINLKPQQIGLWGVDMAAHEEYAFQRPGCHFFIREALKAGIDVYAPPESDILQPGPLYGFKEFTREFWKDRAREKELQGRLNATKEHQSRLNIEEKVFIGAMDDMLYKRNTWIDDGSDFRVPLDGFKGIKTDGEKPVGVDPSGAA